MMPANGLRYPLVGGMGQHRFGGTSFEPRKPLENAASPTSRVHAVLGRLRLPGTSPAGRSLVPARAKVAGDPIRIDECDSIHGLE